MNQKTKIWLIVAGCLIITVLLLFTSVMMANGWDFSLLSTSNYETSTYTISETFSIISIDTDTADITLLPSNDDTCTIVCYEIANAKHSVETINDTLCIGICDEREWYEYISINFDTPKITIYLPQSEYRKLTVNGDTGDMNISKDFRFENVEIAVDTGDVTSFASVSDNLQIKTDTGDIQIENVSVNNLNLTVSTGDTYLSNIDCKNLMTSGSTGDIVLKNVVAEGQFSIERSTGNVKLNGCDAAEIMIETDTGNVTGSLLSEKVFITETSTGRISVPKTTSGGKCNVTTSTGDIQLTVG